ncbi:hypothetical protein [Microcoleus sp. BROC3]
MTYALCLQGRSTPGGGGVRSTFLSLLAFGRNITPPKKIKTTIDLNW